VKGAYFVPIFG